MKKFENLGKSLTKDEQKKITGGDESLDSRVCVISCAGGGTYVQVCNLSCSVVNGIIYCDGRMYSC